MRNASYYMLAICSGNIVNLIILTYYQALSRTDRATHSLLDTSIDHLAGGSHFAMPIL